MPVYDVIFLFSSYGLLVYLKCDVIYSNFSRFVCIDLVIIVLCYRKDEYVLFLLIEANIQGELNCQVWTWSLVKNFGLSTLVFFTLRMW